MTSHTTSFLEKNNLLFARQHGLRSKLSCKTQLTDLLSDLSSALDKGKEVEPILLDFSKTFDCVLTSQTDLQAQGYWREQHGVGVDLLLPIWSYTESSFGGFTVGVICGVVRCTPEVCARPNSLPYIHQ